MYIDVRKLLNNSLTDNDIIINELSTYPKKLIEQMRYEDFCDDDFKNYFYDNTNYNVIGVHFTRLFKHEIDDIKVNGLHSDESADYAKKIQRLPAELDEEKPKILDFVISNKRSHGKIHFDIGKIELWQGNTIFLKNWGGETLYCYYDSLDYSKKDLILASKLRKLTIPCIVIVKVNAYQFFAHFRDNEGLIDHIHETKLREYGNEFCIEQNEVEVIDVIPIKNLVGFIKKG